MCSRYIRALSLTSLKYFNYSNASRIQTGVRPIKLFSTSVSRFSIDQSKTNEKHDNEESILTEEKIQHEQMSEKEKEILEKSQQLLERLNEIDDKYKRALADNENIRTRMRREVNDAKRYAIQNFVKDLLDVSDVLSKAIESVPKESLSEDNPYLKNLFEGLQMTEGQLDATFRRYGVTSLNPLGEKFDPNLHEALFEQEDSTKQPGTVGTVTKVGYKLHDRVIRPALVGVVKAKS